MTPAIDIIEKLQIIAMSGYGQEVSETCEKAALIIAEADALLRSCECSTAARHEGESNGT
jgi:hypothetical protein